MTRWFCDRCAKEIPPNAPDHQRLKAKDIEGRFCVEVTTGVDAWNNGHLCHDCVRALVALTALARGGVVNPGSAPIIVGESGCELRIKVNELAGRGEP